MRRLAFTIAAILALAAPSPSPAQDVPDADPAAELYRTAQLLVSQGELELADALHDYILRRYPESAAAAAIRAARSVPGSRRVESSGRTEVVVYSTLYGLWLGVALPAMVEVDGPEPYGIGLLIGGPVGFFAGRALTIDRPVGDGDAGLFTWGGTWGTWQGFGWTEVLDLGARGCEATPADGYYYYCDDSPSSQAIFGSMILGGLGGMAAATIAAARWQPTPGDATLVSLGSLWGTWFGVASGVIGEVEGDALLGMTLVGGNLGAAAGVALATSFPVSRSEARIASIIGVAGGLAGAGVDLLIQPDNSQVAMGIPLVTSLVGLRIGVSNVGAEPEEGGGTPGNGRHQTFDVRLGGPLFPVSEPGPGGARRSALGVTLLSARF